jgi:hypothetical protein
MRTNTRRRKKENASNWKTCGLQIAGNKHKDAEEYSPQEKTTWRKKMLRKADLSACTNHNISTENASPVTGRVQPPAKEACRRQGEQRSEEESARGAVVKASAPLNAAPARVPARSARRIYSEIFVWVFRLASFAGGCTLPVTGDAFSVEMLWFVHALRSALRSIFFRHFVFS